MITHRIAMGDDPEFALVITDPISGEVVDMSGNQDWEVFFALAGTDILKRFSLGELPVNSGHPDTDAPDGSLKLQLTQAETTAVTPGAHQAYVKVRDSEGNETTDLGDEKVVFNFYLTPLTNL